MARKRQGEREKESGRYLPVCKNRWFLRFVCLEKPLEQMWHLNGHEPLCTYICDFKSPGVGKDFEQRLHLCGFSYNGKQTKIAMLVPYFFSTAFIVSRKTFPEIYVEKIVMKSQWRLVYVTKYFAVLLEWIWFEYLSLVTISHTKRGER